MGDVFVVSVAIEIVGVEEKTDALIVGMEGSKATEVDI